MVHVLAWVMVRVMMRVLAWVRVRVRSLNL